MLHLPGCSARLAAFGRVAPLVLHAGGGDLAKKLIDVYLTLFQLIMTGKVGHAAAAQRAAEERVAAARVPPAPL